MLQRTASKHKNNNNNLLRAFDETEEVTTNNDNMLDGNDMQERDQTTTLEHPADLL